MLQEPPQGQRRGRLMLQEPPQGQRRGRLMLQEPPQGCWRGRLMLQEPPQGWPAERKTNVAGASSRLLERKTNVAGASSRLLERKTNVAGASSRLLAQHSGYKYGRRHLILTVLCVYSLPLLQAPNKQVMQYWLQQLQQKRWDFCNTRGAGTVRDSWSSPTSLYPLTGLVAKDAGPVAGVLCEKPTESMESVRNDFAVETETNGLVGIGSARQHTAPLTPALSSLKNWGSEIRNSMSHLRQRGGENRRSVFYTASQQQATATGASSIGSSGSAEDWEMLDHPTHPAAKEHHGGGAGPPSSTEPSRRDSPSSHFHRREDPQRSYSIGSAFTFDFRSTGGRMKRPFLRDGLLGSVRGSSGSGRSGSADLSPSQVECNGSKQSSELQLRLQSQQEELSRMQEEQTRLREELAGQKELVRLLQQTLRGSQCGPGPGPAPVGHRPPPPPPLPPGGAPEAKGGPGAGGAGAEPGPGPGAGLRGDGAGDAYAQAAQAKAEAWRQEREGHIQALCGHMERLGLEKESLQQELKTLKNKVGEINEQLGMLMETIQAKDEVIIKLSQSGGDDAGSQGEAGSPTGYRDQHELGNLKDSLEGYKSQNNFLNKEILELTVLRRNAESREKAIEAKYTALEAKLCQVESKYLVLLQEVKTPVGATSDVITRLLEDALEVETCSDQPEHTLLKPHTVSEYDTYGFKTLPEEEDEEEKLVAKVRALDLKKLSLTDQEVSVSVKWDNYLAGTMNREMARSPELKALIRSGVPHVHRPKVWRWCVWLHMRKFRECLAEDYYRGLLSLAREKQNPASKQIELDLLRTLPNNKHYASPSSHGIQQLRNVLLAFSWRNPDIGYCQGLNRLAAIALLYLEEEDAFWCLTAIVEVFMPRDYYTKTLLGSQTATVRCQRSSRPVDKTDFKSSNMTWGKLTGGARVWCGPTSTATMGRNVEVRAATCASVVGVPVSKCVFLLTHF
ncbi:TBC1 domain family member 2B [Engraulis encrasicolus]|uniref:TBC1 domain family member 2B n=1 Tax=Engraulis encrasicolus TaxID=184585 RepID=UPI002FD6BBEA